MNGAVEKLMADALAGAAADQRYDQALASVSRAFRRWQRARNPNKVAAAWAEYETERKALEALPQR